MTTQNLTDLTPKDIPITNKTVPLQNTRVHNVALQDCTLIFPADGNAAIEFSNTISGGKLQFESASHYRAANFLLVYLLERGLIRPGSEVPLADVLGAYVDPQGTARA